MASWIGRTIGISAIFALLVLPASCVVREYQLESRFARIAVGMRASEVTAILGKPWRIKDCEGEFKPYQRPDCAETFVYAAPFAPLTPWYPTVWFDRDRRVIHKYEFLSH